MRVSQLIFTKFLYINILNNFCISNFLNINKLQYLITGIIIIIYLFHDSYLPIYQLINLFG